MCRTKKKNNISKRSIENAKTKSVCKSVCKNTNLCAKIKMKPLEFQRFHGGGDGTRAQPVTGAIFYCWFGGKDPIGLFYVEIYVF